LRGEIYAPPISYSFEGKQYIAALAGDTLFTFALTGPAPAAGHR
jgi:hypothetical protein